MARRHHLAAHLRRFAASYLVLAFGLAVTAGAWLLASRTVDREAQARLRNEVDEIAGALEGQIDAYLSALRGARGLFPEGRVPSRAAFRALVESFELSRYYPGIQGVGFTRVLEPGRVAAHEAEVRAEGFPGYRVWPEGDRPVYSSIVFLEPFDWRNQRAFGFDMMSEPTRRAAMERARDTATPAASGPVELVQEAGEERQPGFLMYLPVYRGQPAGVAERRERLVGFVYAPFRAHDLLRGMLRGRALEVEVRDAAAAASPGTAVLYAEGEGAPGPADLVRTVSLPVADREWALRFVQRGGVQSSSQRWLPRWVVLAGVVVSMLLFAVVHREIAAAVENARLYRQAEEAVRTRDEFLSIASHELKTPLTSLVLQADSLMKALRGGDRTDPLRRRAESLKRNVDRLSTLVAELLDFSRLSAGRLSLHLESVDLAEVAREVAERFSDEVARAGSELRLDLRGPVVGRWDRLRLDQVITNLLANAVKYGGGKPIEVAVAEAEETAVITVRDRGIGIPLADQERIFERFERAVSERHYGGFGLGLWISRQLIVALGGTIGVQSREGEGAIFRVELRRRAADAHGDARVSRAAASGDHP